MLIGSANNKLALQWNSYVILNTRKDLYTHAKFSIITEFEANCKSAREKNTIWVTTAKKQQNKKTEKHRRRRRLEKKDSFKNNENLFYRISMWACDVGFHFIIITITVGVA